jgi:3-hydroxyacyl-CoA dehydrogenase
MERLTFTDDLPQAVEGAWYIAETIVEKPEPKQALYAQLDGMLPEDVIIASNTSYLNIFELLPQRRQAYSLISHWYAPAHILPLVEVVKGPETLPEVMDQVTQFHNDCGKTAVRMEKYIPGFIVNRMQSAMTREVLYLIENGYCTAEDLDLAVKTSLMPRGLLLGLVQRMDFNGLDMVAHGMRNKQFSPSELIERPAFIFDHVDKGEYGVKTGKGLYDYSHQSQTETLQERDRALLKSVAMAQQYTKKPLGTK